MTNDAAKFIGACFLVGCGAMAIPLGYLAEATNALAAPDAGKVGLIPLVAGSLVGIPALLRMGGLLRSGKP